jgi:hypothetical protein
MNAMVTFIDFKIEIIKRFLSCGFHWKEAEKMAEAYIVYLSEKGNK